MIRPIYLLSIVGNSEIATNAVQFRRHRLLSQPMRTTDNTTTKLQKLLADAGLGSRRQMETYIIDGRVTVNGVTATIGDRAAIEDEIRVDGRRIGIKQQKAHRYLIYHKPVGEICSRDDPQHENTVFQGLPKLRGQRWVMVGRLDVNTSGLLLLTTDGELAHRLMHPSYQVAREYAVRVLGDVSDVMIARLLNGVDLEDGFAKFESLSDAGGSGANHWYHVVLREGRKREVRRLWESQDVTVSRLIRIGFANIRLPRDLKAGYFCDIDPQELKQLQQSVAL